jgi:hypothetical protein
MKAVGFDAPSGTCILQCLDSNVFLDRIAVAPRAGPLSPRSQGGLLRELLQQLTDWEVRLGSDS